MSIPSDRCIEALKRSEGFRAEPYVCPAGRATIGYGHNLEAHPAAIRLWSPALADLAAKGGLRGEELTRRLKAVRMVWDKAHAEEWLRHDLSAVLAGLAGHCPAYNGLVARGDEARAEVLADMPFNMGLRGLLGFRKMLSAVEDRDWDRAADEMLDSEWSRQVGRRAADLSRRMRGNQSARPEGQV